MYNIDEIKSIHFEVTSKCQARCPMCPRRIQGGPLRDGVDLEEITLTNFMKWFDVDFIKQLNHFSMCGNLGDPMIAEDTLEIFNYLYEHNPHMGLQMHTNGSGRSIEWWQALAKINVTVIFGIDGLKDTHSLYRINTNWDKIIANAKEFISAGGNARWDMLVFKHNEHQVDACKQLSKELGFTEFTMKHSARFRDGKLDVIDDDYNVINTLYPTKHSKDITAKVKTAEKQSLPTITCKAKEDSMLYISATGNVAPCCWLDLEWAPKEADGRIEYMGKIKRFPNLHDGSLREIFDSGFFRDISGCWTTTGLKECSKQCGSFDKLNSQFVEKIEHE